MCVGVCVYVCARACVCARMLDRALALGEACSLSLEPEGSRTSVDPSPQVSTGWLESSCGLGRRRVCQGRASIGCQIIGSQVEVIASLLWKATVSPPHPAVRVAWHVCDELITWQGAPLKAQSSIGSAPSGRGRRALATCSTGEPSARRAGPRPSSFVTARPTHFSPAAVHRTQRGQSVQCGREQARAARVAGAGRAHMQSW